MTTIVGRHEPRNRRTVSAVSRAAITPSRMTLITEEVTNTDWPNRDLIAMPEGAEARAKSSTCLRASTTVKVDALPFLMMLSRAERLPSGRRSAEPGCRRGHDRCREGTGGTVGVADRDVVEGLNRRRHRIGPGGVLRVADFLRAARQCQILGVDSVHHLQRRQSLGQQLRLVDVDHDLAVFAAGWGQQGYTMDRRDHLPLTGNAAIVEL